MRFGIMTMQKGALIPAGISAAGTSATGHSAAEAMAALASLDHAAIARHLSEFGFNPIELGGDMALFFPQSFAPETVAQLATLREETGLGYTVHLPLWSTEPSTTLEPVREGSVRALVDIVERTLPLKPEVYVLHATGALAAEFYRMDLPDLARQFVLRQFQAAAGQSLRAILDQTGIDSRRLAIETIEFPLDLTLELAEELDLSVCLDTGHVLAGFSGTLGFFETLEACLPRLAEVHLHDAPQWRPGQPLGYGTDHKPLGTGDLDVARLLARLEEAGFSGPIIFELTVEEALASLAVVRAG
jgi:sugar phosphate isomerase/epimerase